MPLICQFPFSLTFIPSDSSGGGAATTCVPLGGPDKSSIELPATPPTVTGTERTAPSSPTTNTTLLPPRATTASATTIFFGGALSASSLTAAERKLTRALISGSTPSIGSTNLTFTT